MSVGNEGGQWTYFVGTVPVFGHAGDDRKSFYLITAQLTANGTCRQADVIRTFGVSRASLARAQRLYLSEGPAGFYAGHGNRRVRRRGRVMTDELLVAGQRMLDEGLSPAAAATELGISADTFRKAIEDGRLRLPTAPATKDKSSRSAEDSAAGSGMGTACTRTGERVLAAMGLIDGASQRFDACLDVPYGGVLCALPALLANGLLTGAEGLLNRVHGYYSAVHVLVLLGFMTLCRIRSVEQLRKEAPGEFGKLIGLDRIPEVRCLRRKLSELADNGAAERWAAHLSAQWMTADPDAVGTLLIDGHVRPYHGSKAALPRRYVPNQRLCLRGTTDYWVNDGTGLPFFVVEKAVDPGLLQVLREDIVPRLLVDIPDQPTDRDLEDNPYLCRFVLVFDREGYSPAFFKEMWQQHRIACISYHKHPRGTWPEEWFASETVTMSGGEQITVRLAEMGSMVGSGENAMWMREVRKLTGSGHQVSLIMTQFTGPCTELAGRLFSRWCQENFFKYMIQHFGMELLSEYATEPLLDTERVVNPTWRALNRRRNSVNGKLTRRRAKFAAMDLHPVQEEDVRRHRRWELQRADLLEEIQQFEAELADIKEEMSNTDRHIDYGQLPEEERFEAMVPTRRALLNTVRMIAYRAETAMANLLRDRSTDSSEARAILQALYRTSADLMPDTANNRLVVRVHGSATPASDKRLRELFEKLNQTETEYPGTPLKLVYEMVGSAPRATD